MRETHEKYKVFSCAAENNKPAPFSRDLGLYKKKGCFNLFFPGIFFPQACSIYQELGEIRGKWSKGGRHTEKICRDGSAQFSLALLHIPLINRNLHNVKYREYKILKDLFFLKFEHEVF